VRLNRLRPGAKLELGDELEAFVTYDRQMIQAEPVAAVAFAAARSSDSGHEPEHAAHLGARLTNGRELDVELRP